LGRQAILLAGSVVPSQISTEQEVHDPTSSNMRPWPPAVAHEFFVGATSFFQFVGQFGHPVESTFLVDRLGQLDDSGCQPRGGNGGMPAAIPEDFPE
jgi:hypothetical protein